MLIQVRSLSKILYTYFIICKLNNVDILFMTDLKTILCSKQVSRSDNRIMQ